MLNEITQYGFNYGSARVERSASDETKQWVYITVHTPKVGQHVSVYVTKTGKTRVYKNGVELK